MSDHIFHALSFSNQITNFGVPSALADGTWCVEACFDDCLMDRTLTSGLSGSSMYADMDIFVDGT